ncbi:TPA: small membrane protein [Klebsiella pneumoniae]|uniref:small membrane protein n=1 Tax=Klebsiella TaxID=570 RepID=UPI0020601808|nr:MAG TPA: hypothetical protein [Caudoviricetes sp.]
MHNQCMKYNFNNNNKKSSKIINLPKLLIRIFLTLTIESSPQKTKLSTYISRDYTCMANLLILALAVVLFIVAVLSFVSYTKDRKKLKNTFKKRY